MSVPLDQIDLSPLSVDEFLNDLQSAKLPSVFAENSSFSVDVGDNGIPLVRVNTNSGNWGSLKGERPSLILDIAGRDLILELSGSITLDVTEVDRQKMAASVLGLEALVRVKTEALDDAKKTKFVFNHEQELVAATANARTHQAALEMRHSENDAHLATLNVSDQAMVLRDTSSRAFLDNSGKLVALQENLTIMIDAMGDADDPAIKALIDEHRTEIQSLEQSNQRLAPMVKNAFALLERKRRDAIIDTLRGNEPTTQTLAVAFNVSESLLSNLEERKQAALSRFAPNINIARREQELADARTSLAQALSDQTNIMPRFITTVFGQSEQE